VVLWVSAAAGLCVQDVRGTVAIKNSTKVPIRFAPPSKLRVPNLPIDPVRQVRRRGAGRVSSPHPPHAQTSRTTGLAAAPQAAYSFRRNDAETL